MNDQTTYGTVSIVFCRFVPTERKGYLFLNRSHNLQFIEYSFAGLLPIIGGNHLNEPGPGVVQ